MMAQRDVVLMFHPSVELYGADRMLLQSINALTRFDRVVVLPSDGPLVAYAQESGARVIVQKNMLVLRKAMLHPQKLLLLPFRALACLASTAVIVFLLRPKVCYVNTVTLPFCLLAARLLRKPTVCHLHEADKKVGRLARKFLTAPLVLSTKIVAASLAAREFAGQSAGKKLTVVHNCVPIPNACPPLPAVQPNPLKVLLVGRWSPRKGTDLAVRAMRDLRSAGVDVRLSLVGGTFEGYEWFERDLRELIRRCGLQDHVSLVGFVEDPTPLYRDTHIVLVPSRGDETFGLVAVEAQLHRRIVIASATGGLAEVIEDGVNGWLVPPGSVTALVYSINQRLADWTRTVEIANRSRDVAAAKFNSNIFGARLRVVLDEVLES
jgi:glycosyltransferase involved in cell wall biosynthesis